MHGLYIEANDAYRRQQAGYPVLRQKCEPAGQERIAKVLRVAGDGIQAALHNRGRLHVWLFLANRTVLGEQVERPKDEYGCQEQRQDACDP